MELEVLKDKIKNKEFKQAIDIVRKELIIEIEKEIRKKNVNFKYTNIYNLIDASEKYIDNDKKNIAKCLYTPEYMELDEKDELVMLLENYKVFTY